MVGNILTKCMMYSKSLYGLVYIDDSSVHMVGVRGGVAARYEQGCDLCT
jgi:hypothetical protein